MFKQTEAVAAKFETDIQARSSFSPTAWNKAKFNKL
jgi:hypothetical protein